MVGEPVYVSDSELSAELAALTARQDAKLADLTVRKAAVAAELEPLRTEFALASRRELAAATRVAAATASLEQLTTSRVNLGMLFKGKLAAARKAATDELDSAQQASHAALAEKSELAERTHPLESSLSQMSRDMDALLDERDQLRYDRIMGTGGPAYQRITSLEDQVSATRLSSRQVADMLSRLGAVTARLEAAVRKLGESSHPSLAPHAIPGAFDLHVADLHLPSLELTGWVGPDLDVAGAGVLIDQLNSQLAHLSSYTPSRTIQETVTSASRLHVCLEELAHQLGTHQEELETAILAVIDEPCPDRVVKARTRPRHTPSRLI